MAIGIYKITNNLNSKVYIGQSRNIAIRWEAHKTKARSLQATKGNNMYITNAMRKDGIENFTKETIETCSIADLDDREKYWIEFYDSTNRDKGYNQLKGGHNPIGSILTKEQVDEIYNLLSNTKISMNTIGQQFGVSENSIWYINTGQRWVRDNTNYPLRNFRGANTNCKVLNIDKEEFIKVLKTSYVKGAAEYYGVHYTTIRKWCDYFGLPKTMAAIKAL